VFPPWPLGMASRLFYVRGTWCCRVPNVVLLHVNFHLLADLFWLTFRLGVNLGCLPRLLSWRSCLPALVLVVCDPPLASGTVIRKGRPSSLGGIVSTVCSSSVFSRRGAFLHWVLRRQAPGGEGGANSSLLLSGRQTPQTCSFASIPSGRRPSAHRSQPPRPASPAPRPSWAA